MVADLTYLHNKVYLIALYKEKQMSYKTSNTRFPSVVIGCLLLLILLFSGTETLLGKYSEWHTIRK